MKFSYLKRGVCTLCVVSMLLSLFGCGKQTEETAKVVIEPMEVEEVYSCSFDIMGGDDVMPIGGYYGPYSPFYSYNGVNMPDYQSDELFKKLIDCGINMINFTETDYNAAPAKTMELLDLGEKYGVGIMVRDSLISEAKGANISSMKDLAERVSAYDSKPAFIGLYLVDEAGCDYYHPELKDAQGFLSDYEETCANLEKLGIPSYTNLIGYHGQPNQQETWEKYIQEGMTKLCTNYVSYTHAFAQSANRDEWDNNTITGYFWALDTIQYYAEQYKIPAWQYIYAGGQPSDGGERFDSEPYFPTEGQFTWNINTGLSMGTKGFMYFPLIQPYWFSYAKSTPFDAQRIGLLGIWGNKTQWYHYAEKNNAQIAAVDHVLMNSRRKGVIASGEQAEADLKGLRSIMEGKSWRELKDIQGNAIVGCFNFQGKTALYVTNYEMEYAQKVTLNFHDSYNIRVIQNAKESTMHTGKLTLDFAAGEGALIVFE